MSPPAYNSTIQHKNSNEIAVATQEALAAAAARRYQKVGSSAFSNATPRFGAHHSPQPKPSVGTYDPNPEVIHKITTRPCGSVFRSSSARFGEGNIQHTAPITYVGAPGYRPIGSGAASSRSSSAQAIPMERNASPSFFMCSRTPRMPESKAEKAASDMKKRSPTPEESWTPETGRSSPGSPGYGKGGGGVMAGGFLHTKRRNEGLMGLAIGRNALSPKEKEARSIPGPGTYDAVTSGTGGVALGQGSSGGAGSAKSFFFSSKVNRFGEVGGFPTGPGIYSPPLINKNYYHHHRGVAAEKSQGFGDKSKKSDVCFAGVASKRFDYRYIVKDQ